MSFNSCAKMKLHNMYLLKTVILNRNPFLCQSKKLLMISCIKKTENSEKFNILKRTVHYEPLANEKMDKKQKEIIKNLGISIEDCERNPGIWKIHPYTIEHHGLLLLEGGFVNLCASYIVNYLKIIKKNVGLLKLHNYISTETSVVNSFLKHLGDPPIAQSLLRTVNKNEIAFTDVYKKVLKNYLIWRLEGSESEIDKIMKTYPRINHRSLKYLSWSLDIIENELGFSKEKIRRHGYLIHSYPYNTLDTLQRLPTLAGKDIKDVFQNHPKIIMVTTDNIVAIAQHLKNFGIPDCSIQRCFELFTLGSDSVEKRLQQMWIDPELRPFVHHPRVLDIVHYLHKVNDRISKLRKLQRNCISLHVLIAHQTIFDKYTRDGSDRTRGFDIVSLLMNTLGEEDVKLRENLSRHPYWCNVSSVTVVKTLDTLLERGFEKEDILKNVHLLLYPSEQVEKILDEPNIVECVKCAQNIVKANLCSEKEVQLTKSSELALCLYFIEKDHHFSGNGIWNS